MSVEEFRRLALALPGVVEVGHMGHPDFRASGRIFATLAYPDEAWAMVKLAPEDQAVFVGAHPSVFRPVKGAWGRQGSTNMRLDAATEEIAGEALTAAWRLASAKKPARRQK
jgi:hypothetical protein